MPKLKGRHLKEVTYDLILESPLGTGDAKALLEYLIKYYLKTKIVSTSVNMLKPGWDISFTIKESIVYLGYWPERNYVHIILSSCKNFNENKIKDALEDFNNATYIQMNVRYDMSINKLIKKIKC